MAHRAVLRAILADVRSTRATPALLHGTTSASTLRRHLNSESSWQGTSLASFGFTGNLALLKVAEVGFQHFAAQIVLAAGMSLVVTFKRLPQISAEDGRDGDKHTCIAPYWGPFMRGPRGPRPPGPG